MSVTSGVSLAKIGMSRGSCSRTRATTLALAIGSQAKTRPRLATLGQEMLTSTPTTASKASLARRVAATSANSPLVLPAMETRVRAPACLSQARSLSTNAEMPGPWSPIELSIPAGVSAIRGVPRPDRGSAITDLVTNAPSSRMSKNRASSRPLAAQPEAVIIGLGRVTAPSRTDMSTAISDHPPGVRRPCRRAPGIPRRRRRPTGRGHRGRPAPRRTTAPSASPRRCP